MCSLLTAPPPSLSLFRAIKATRDLGYEVFADFFSGYLTSISPS